MKKFVFIILIYIAFKTEDKLQDVGIWESLEDKSSLTLIEWANLFPSVLQVCNLEFYFSFEKDNFLISYKGND